MEVQDGNTQPRSNSTIIYTTLVAYHPGRITEVRFCSVVVITPDFDVSNIPATPVRIWARPHPLKFLVCGFGYPFCHSLIESVIFSRGVDLGGRESVA